MRGQVAHPLNWILVLFAGAVFLIFFVVLIRGMTEGSDARQAVADLSYIEDMIESSQANPDTATGFRSKEFVTDCDQGIFTARMMPQTLDFPGQAIFSSPTIDGEAILWSHQFELGGPIMALSYLVSENTLFLLFDPNGPPTHPSWAEVLLPKNATTRIVTQADINDGIKGYDTLVLISDVALNGVRFKPRGGVEIIGIHVNPSIPGKTLSDGMLDFYTTSSSAESFFMKRIGSEAYLGKALLVGGIVSGGPRRYACARSVVEQKSRFIARINMERLTQLNASITLEANAAGANPDARCIDAYDRAVVDYALLKNPAFTINRSLTPYLLVKQRLSQGNTKLGMANCPMIY